MADQEEDFSNLPLPERFAHKVWKVRKEAYEAATKEFKSAQPTDPIVKEFIHDSGLWKAAVADSNVAAQTEALNAYCAFLEIAGPSASTRYCPSPTCTFTPSPCSLIDMTDTSPPSLCSPTNMTNIAHDHTPSSP